MTLETLYVFGFSIVLIVEVTMYVHISYVFADEIIIQSHVYSYTVMRIMLSTFNNRWYQNLHEQINKKKNIDTKKYHWHPISSHKQVWIFYCVNKIQQENENVCIKSKKV